METHLIWFSMTVVSLILLSIPPKHIETNFSRQSHPRELNSLLTSEQFLFTAKSFNWLNQEAGSYINCGLPVRWMPNHGGCAAVDQSDASEKAPCIEC